MRRRVPSRSGAARPAPAPSPRGRRAASLGESAIEPRQVERQQVAALGGDERMQLVDDDALQAAEQGGGFAVRKEQRQLFGRRQQDVGRPLDLPLRAVRRRIAGAGLDLDGQRPSPRPARRGCAHVDGQRLERRDVERVQASRLAEGRALRPASSMRLGRKPASVLPPPVGAISSTDRPGLAPSRRARAGDRAALQPRDREPGVEAAGSGDGAWAGRAWGTASVLNLVRHMFGSRTERTSNSKSTLNQSFLVWR